MELSCPSYLEPYRFNTPPLVYSERGLSGITFPDVSQIVRERVRHLTTEQFTDWKRQRHADYVPSSKAITCSFDFRILQTPEADFLFALDVVMNDDLFVLGAEDCSDLQDLCLEHEAWELWERFINVDPSIAHMVARIHQYVLAVMQGKDERLIDFYHRHSAGDLDLTHVIAIDFARNHRWIRGDAGPGLNT